MSRLPYHFLSQTLLVLGIVLALPCGESVACNVPVFRYALERWKPDPYRVTIFYRAAIDSNLLAPLERLADRIAPPLSVRRVDVENLETPTDKELWKTLGEQSLPLVVLQYPERLGEETPFWTAPLNQESIARVIDSPIRAELVRHLTRGESAVWIFLESGDRTRDDALAATLTKELNTLALTMKLPALTDTPDDKLMSNIPLKISFSVLRLPRAEKDDVLAQVLSPKFLEEEEAQEALAFPVFGRGRALPPLQGSEINGPNLAEYAEFLIGACSCQVKEQNPGFDLLICADWDELVLKSDDVPHPEIAITPESPAEMVRIPRGNNARSIPALEAVSTTLPPKHRLGNNWFFAAGLVFAAGILWTAARRAGG